MQENWNNYLSQLRLTNPAKERIESIVQELGIIYPGITFNDIFISQAKKETGIGLKSLWLLSESVMVECKNFITDDDYDLISLKSLSYFKITKKNFIVSQEPKDTSEVFIYGLFFTGSMNCSLSAYGMNCKYAMDIANKYIIPNIAV